MVPNGWEETRLKHIARIKSGSTPLRAKQDLYYSQDGTPWVKTLDLNNAEIFETDERITELALKETSCSIFPVNTVLVAMYGGFNQIGRTGLLTVPSAINQALSGLMLDDNKADSKYILNYLNGNVRQWKKFAASSRKDPNITREDVCNFEVLLPPLPEQRKIAKILSTWDKAIATTEQLIATSQQQKKALMQQLLTGKKRLVDPETGKAFEGGGEEVKLNKCVKFLNGQRKPIKQEDRANIQGKYPYYGATGIIDYVNDYIFDDEIILLGEDGENILSRVLPHVFVVRGKVWVNNHAHVLKANANMDTNFLCMYLESLDYKRYNSGSAQPKINKAVCEKIPVVVPVLAEQQKIASVLTAADKEIELLVAKLAHLKEEKKALMQQLLTGKRRVKIEHMEEATC
ncbi:restriction endonuclease subunit S [Vibrio cholerae]|nr:restriction endonuclease subunit S [Vibrio cholerae]